MIKIRIDGQKEEIEIMAEKIRRAGFGKFREQSKFYPNRGENTGRIYLDLEVYDLIFR